MVFIEVKSLYASTGEVPSRGLRRSPWVRPAIPRSGTDITVVATGAMVGESLLAAEALAAEGIDVEVVDPRTLSRSTSRRSWSPCASTHRALVVHEAVRFGGFGAEIASQIQEHAFDDLDAPVGRIGAPFSPVPFSPALEDAYVPNAARIQDEIRALCNR